MTAEIVKTGGALAVRHDQTEWTDAQAAVLRQSGINDEVTAAELSGFLHLCQRTQLDPFSRQIYLIGRFDKRKQRTVFTPQTGIDGYRVVAHRVVGEHRDTFGYEDTVWCGEDGRWRDVWLSQQPPAAAKVTVLRNGQRFPAIAHFAEYVQMGNYGPQGLWGRMPASQLAKCAEALALRKAFPHDLAGVYTAEEMAQADNPTPEERQQRQASEPDPWATAQPASPDGNVAVKGRSQAAQDFADRGSKAATPAEVKELYREANAAGLLAETVKVDRELLELGNHLIARGQQLSDATPQQVPGPAEDGIPDAETFSDEHDAWADALATLEAAAAKAQVRRDELEEAFQTQYGTPTEQATMEQLRQMTAVLTRGAA